MKLFYVELIQSSFLKIIKKGLTSLSTLQVKMYVSEMVYHSSMFIEEFKKTLHGSQPNNQEIIILFKAFFGVTPHVCSIIWKMINRKAQFILKKKHLLWALYFLRQYGTYNNMKVIFGASRVTISKYLWKTIDLLAEMQVVSINLYVIFVKYLI